MVPTAQMRVRVRALLVIAGLFLCTPSWSQEPPLRGSGPAVHVVLFTHIEDNTPAGALGSAANRTSYLNLRSRLLELGSVIRLHGARWSLQPDWKILLAAQQYETPEVTALTQGLNVFRYLKEVLGVSLDPHSHENGGYNYTDVAHLLTTLGVGGSTVIGGHIWDPSLPQFQEWDRYRDPVQGTRYPAATWRGDILMGSGTPNHVNDPILSGLWRPRDRWAYFEDDPAGNVVSVGAFRGDLPGITELVEASRTGAVASDCLLTSTYGLRPVEILAANGVAALETNVIRPLVDLRDRGYITLTDFTDLVEVWRRDFLGRSCLFGPSAPTPSR